MSWVPGFTAPPPHRGGVPKSGWLSRGKIKKNQWKLSKSDLSTTLKVITASKLGFLGMLRCMSSVALLDRPHKTHRPTTVAYPLTLVLSSTL